MGRLRLVPFIQDSESALCPLLSGSVMPVNVARLLCAHVCPSYVQRFGAADMMADV